MTSRSTVLSSLVLALVLALGGTASAGVAPSPFHVVVANRTHLLSPSSPFYNQDFLSLRLVVVVSVPDPMGGDGGTWEETVPLGSANGALGVPAGQTLAFVPDLANVQGTILSWSLRAELGVGPSPFTLGVFAYPRVPEAPANEPPDLPAAYLTPEMPIVGFASPGVVLGTVALVNDQIYGACPSIPEDGAWKNHGHYVRCVAQAVDGLAGVITTDEADAIVSAAAQSATGKE